MPEDQAAHRIANLELERSLLMRQLKKGAALTREALDTLDPAAIEDARRWLYRVEILVAADSVGVAPPA